VDVVVGEELANFADGGRAVTEFGFADHGVGDSGAHVPSVR
jgi:hypothetical protein